MKQAVKLVLAGTLAVAMTGFVPGCVSPKGPKLPAPKRLPAPPKVHAPPLPPALPLPPLP